MHGEMKMKANKMLFIYAALALLAPLALTGCGDKKTEDAAAEQTAKDQEAAGPSESLDSPPQDQSQSSISEGRTSGPMLPVYFDFDSAKIREDQVSRIEGNGDYLKGSEKVKVQIEGNCDSRGTNEYNLALGEKRAQAAKKYLLKLGVAEDRLSTVSWGEEKPLVSGQDEMSWAQNRRDDFVIMAE
jgi:peptidoglycan-associated lipoprotein